MAKKRRIPFTCYMCGKRYMGKQEELKKQYHFCGKSCRMKWMGSFKKNNHTKEERNLNNKIKLMANIYQQYKKGQITQKEASDLFHRRVEYI